MGRTVVFEWASSSFEVRNLLLRRPTEKFCKNNLQKMSLFRLTPYTCFYKLYKHFWQSKSNSGYPKIHPFISQRLILLPITTANISLVGCICSVMHKQHLLPSQSTWHGSLREECRSESLLNVAHQVSTC